MMTRPMGAAVRCSAASSLNPLFQELESLKWQKMQRFWKREKTSSVRSTGTFFSVSPRLPVKQGSKTIGWKWKRANFLFFYLKTDVDIFLFVSFLWYQLWSFPTFILISNVPLFLTSRDLVIRYIKHPDAYQRQNMTLFWKTMTMKKVWILKHMNRIWQNAFHSILRTL